MNIKSCEYWDGNASMPVVLDDGGREMAGFKGRAGDCVTRAIAIAWGFRWTPTMLIGSGCKVHLLKGELPAGRLVVALSKHCTAVIDGIVHDTYDPHRSGLSTMDGVTRLSHRCVYGFWQFNR